MQVDWTINFGDILTVGGGIVAFLYIGVQFRDTLRDLAIMVKAHAEKIDDHEDRIRFVERRHTQR